MMLSKLEVMILKQLDNLKICSDIIDDIIDIRESTEVILWITKRLVHL